MDYMFNQASSFNQGGISSWAVSQVTSADYMFQNAVTFNQDLNWTPSSCKSFKYMFNQASRFDANIFTSTGSADVDMEGMFQNTASFTGKKVNEMNTAAVTSMKNMFKGANRFNLAIPTSTNIWKTEAVKD